VANTERWKQEPDEHDYPAARDFLTLLLTDRAARTIVDHLRRAPIVHRKAKDLLRASGLALLPSDNVHVAKDLQKVKDQQKLSPVLLWRGDIAGGRPLTIADGYHRICASHNLDEDADIPCRIVDPPSVRTRTRS
jgi:hypothetical protein